MALTDIDISEILETNAPSIKYRGNEGPKSPEEQLMASADPMLVEEYKRYVYEMEEQGRPPISFEQFVQEIMSGMAQGGRAGYGLGNIVKKITRPVKKFVKSDAGKAALTAAAIYGLGGGFGGPTQGWGLNQGFKMGNIMPNLKTMAFGKSPISMGGNRGMGPGIMSKGTKGIFGSGGQFSPLKALGITSVLPFALGGGKEEDTLGINIPDSQKFDVNFSEMRKDIAEAVASGVKENFDIVLDKYDLVEGVNINRWEDLRTGAAQGGRIGYKHGNLAGILKRIIERREKKRLLGEERELRPTGLGAAQGGRIGAQEGGLMDLGGMEKDYRNDGGFVPIGGEEKADDVPARLSKNEFVFTADAVRAAGGGDIDKGAGIMERVMENLEQGGRISEESQGLSGAQEMFDVSERLSEVV